MNFTNSNFHLKPKTDLLVRLAAIKVNHGNYRKAQDAIAEITKLRADNLALREENRRLGEELRLTRRVA